MSLPKDAAKRKTYPIASGVLDYFHDALAEVAHVSHVGNEQHNSGQALHWERSKSTDEADALIRHFIDRGAFDTDGIRHSAKVAWRALALLQKEIEATEGLPISRGSMQKGVVPTPPEALQQTYELRTSQAPSVSFQYDPVRDTVQGCPPFAGPSHFTNHQAGELSYVKDKDHQ